jgi:hypothetical protein
MINSWRDIIGEPNEIVLPWLGGRELRSPSRATRIDGQLPKNFGWHRFFLTKKQAIWEGEARPQEGLLCFSEVGYLVGDHLLDDQVRVDPNPEQIAKVAERVHLIEEGLDRFARIRAGRVYASGPLIYMGQEMPLGPESEVLTAYLDRKENLNGTKGVVPALDAAFQLETYQRKQVEIRRAEAERRRKEEQERLEREERRRQIAETLGTGVGRREMAQVDFAEAAKAALAIGEGEYLDSRKGAQKSEMVVRFRLDGRRYECTCDAHTLAVIDAGLCLTSHGDDGFDYGTKGDKFFNLESICSVYREARREGKLVVLRRVD